MSERILLIGAGGQVGLAWQALALREGMSLSCLTRAQCDLSDAHALRDYLEEHRPQVIINAAAYTAVDSAENDEVQAYAVNATAVGVMAKYLSHVPHSVLIHYSTDYVFSGEGTEPYAESDATGPLSVYGKTKLAGERLIEQAYADTIPQAASHAQHYILRTSWVYGQGQNFIQTMLRLMKEREHLRVVSDQKGVPTCAQWLAQIGLVLMRAQAASGIYHAVPDGLTSWHGLAQFVLEEAQSLTSSTRTQTIEAITSAEYPQAAPRPKNSALHHERFRAVWVAHTQEPYPNWQEPVKTYVKACVQGAPQQPHIN